MTYTTGWKHLTRPMEKTTHTNLLHTYFNSNKMVLVVVPHHYWPSIALLKDTTDNAAISSRLPKAVPGPDKLIRMAVSRSCPVSHRMQSSASPKAMIYRIVPRYCISRNALGYLSTIYTKDAGEDTGVRPTSTMAQEQDERSAQPKRRPRWQAPTNVVED